MVSGLHRSIAFTAARAKCHARRTTFAQGYHQSTSLLKSSSVAPVVDFDDPVAAYGWKSNNELFIAYGIFSLCSLQPIVSNADRLVALSTRTIGSKVTNYLIEKTFFAHFCGGTDEESIKPLIQQYQSQNVLSILDYAAEADLTSQKPNKSDVEKKPGAVADVRKFRTSNRDSVDSDKVPVTLQRAATNTYAREYDYVSEVHCDENQRIFERCIESVKNVSPAGFAAIKVTALGNPKLLERVSTMMDSTLQLFSLLDKDGDGLVGLEEFKNTFKLYFAAESDEEIEKLFAEIVMKCTMAKSPLHDYTGGLSVGEEDEITLERREEYLTRQLDVIEWTQIMSPQDITDLVQRCHRHGNVYKAALNDEELELYHNMLERLSKVCSLAKSLGVKVLIDAEQSYFQSAIHAMVLNMQREYNTEGTVVFNTYQCYRKDALDMIKLDLERAKREGWYFATKLVRGAYLVAETARAEELAYENPIHDTVEDTHRCYNDAVKLTISESKHGGVMIATHNRVSCETAVEAMKQHGLAPHNSGIYFGQLLGMADNLTFSLGKAGYLAYKYVPYGPVAEVMPYLIRRAQENASLAANLKNEKRAISRELKRRYFG